jgi:hypothetical protein
VHFRERTRIIGCAFSKLISRVLVKKRLYDYFRIYLIRPICVICDTIAGFLEGIENLEAIVSIADNRRSLLYKLKDINFDDNKARKNHENTNESTIGDIHLKNTHANDYIQITTKLKENKSDKNIKNIIKDIRIQHKNTNSIDDISKIESYNNNSSKDNMSNENTLKVNVLENINDCDLKKNDKDKTVFLFSESLQNICNNSDVDNIDDNIDDNQNNSDSSISQVMDNMYDKRDVYVSRTMYANTLRSAGIVPENKGKSTKTVKCDVNECISDADDTSNVEEDTSNVEEDDTSKKVDKNILIESYASKTSDEKRKDNIKIIPKIMKIPIRLARRKFKNKK